MSPLSVAAVIVVQKRPFSDGRAELETERESIPTVDAQKVEANEHRTPKAKENKRKECDRGMDGAQLS